MTLVPPQPDYQFIQSSTPSNAKKSDWWLDTSTSPPKSKVYDGSSFVRPEEVEFVDARVSSAGGGVDWSSKTAVNDQVSAGGSQTINGSGYFLGFTFQSGGGNPDSEVMVGLDLDGTEIFRDLFMIYPNGNVANNVPLFHRFDSSFTAYEDKNQRAVDFHYLLD